MDVQAAKNDVRKILKLLPPPALDKLGALLTDHIDDIAKVVPEVIDLVWPHARAAMMEAGAGILDMEELEGAWWELAAEFGWKQAPLLTPGE
jgi:hypothetical protein